MRSARQAAITRTAASSDCGGQSHYTVDRAIKNRFSCRTFSSRAVPRTTIEDILDVARFAPSGANTQPWRVYVVAGPVKEEISRRLLNAHEEDHDVIRGQYHGHPYGELNMVVPIDKGAEIRGLWGWQGPGWTAPDPGSRHYPEVRGGALIAMFFLPAGRISYEFEPPK